MTIRLAIILYRLLYSWSIHGRVRVEPQPWLGNLLCGAAVNLLSFAGTARVDVYIISTTSWLIRKYLQNATIEISLENGVRKTPISLSHAHLKGNYHENMTFGVKRQMCSYEKDKIYGEANLSEFYLILAKSEL